MSDLIKRLRRRIVVDGCEMPGNDALHREAADRIEELEAKLAYTAEALARADKALAGVYLSVCPNCGGPADNGHDRAYPPNPYWCTKCTQETDDE